MVLLGSLAAGYKWALERDCKEKLSFLNRNFQRFPQDIQLALQNNDARYAQRFLE